MPNEAKAIEALRAGNIDIVDQISPVQALAVRNTNPEILQVTTLMQMPKVLNREMMLRLLMTSESERQCKLPSI